MREITELKELQKIELEMLQDITSLEVRFLERSDIRALFHGMTTSISLCQGRTMNSLSKS